MCVKADLFCEELPSETCGQNPQLRTVDKPRKRAKEQGSPGQAHGAARPQPGELEFLGFAAGLHWMMWAAAPAVILKIPTDAP